MNSGVIVGYDIGVPVLGFVHLHVTVLPRELLPGFDRLKRKCHVSKCPMIVRCGQKFMMLVHETLVKNICRLWLQDKI